MAKELWEPWKVNGSTLEHVFREHNTAADALASNTAAGRPLDGSRNLWIPQIIPDLQQEAMNNSGEWNAYS